MKKFYLILLALFTLSVSVNSTTIQKGKYQYCNHKHHKHNSKYYDYSNCSKASRQDILDEIEFKLNILKDKYKRDEKRLEHSCKDKYDLKIRKKELKFKYQKEEKRLKAQKKAIKESLRS